MDMDVVLGSSTASLPMSSFQLPLSSKDGTSRDSSVSHWGDSTVTLPIDNVRPSLKLRVQQEQQERRRQVELEQEKAAQEEQECLVEQQRLKHQSNMEKLRKIEEMDANLSSTHATEDEVSLEALFLANQANHHRCWKQIDTYDGCGQVLRLYPRHHRQPRQLLHHHHEEHHRHMYQM
jgi:hypothetical protein